jgi:hypothetical protein
MASKKQVFAATMLAAIAITAIAYAHLLAGAITVTPEKVVYTYNKSVTFPQAEAGAFPRRVEDILELRFSAGGFAGGDKVLVKVELVIDDPRAYGLRSLVVKLVNNGTNDVVAELTPGTPYDEFVVTVPGSQSVWYDAIVIAGGISQHTGDIPIKISATITGWA